jgi:hypothetical protein
MYRNCAADIPGVGDQLNVDDPVEVQLWAKLFNIPADDLQMAVADIGPDYGNLVDYLADRRQKRLGPRMAVFPSTWQQREH